MALLNDLFGIQARGGCSCAGPYGHRLLGIDMDHSTRFRDAINSGCEGIKPGWVRVNFNYFISEAVFNYILDAVHLVAEAGWMLLPYYRFSVDSGLWRHRDHQIGRELGLDDLSFESGDLEYLSSQLTEPESALARYLDDARRIVAKAEAEYRWREGICGSGGRIGAVTVVPSPERALHQRAVDHRRRRRYRHVTGMGICT